MLKKGKPRKFTRRHFLKTSSLLAGAAMLTPVVPAQAKSLSGAGKTLTNLILQQSAKIGILLPRTRGDSPAMQSFLAGLQLQLKSGRNANRVQLISQTVRSGLGALEDKFEKFSEQAKPDLILGFTNPAHSYLQAASFEAGAKQPGFLGVSLGENVPRIEEAARGYRQNVAHLSFMSVEANWAVGRWAALHVGQKAVLATSFYDSGFDTLYAFQSGFESAGGQLVGRLISHNAVGQNNLAQLPQLVEQTQPDLVFASYHGQAAREFLTAYQKTNLVTNLPLFGSSFLTAGNNLEYAFPGIKTGLAWSAALENPATPEFNALYSEKLERLPDTFAMLGYEAALLATDFLNTGKFSSLANTPRAELRLNTFDQFSSSALYLHEVQSSGGLLVNSPTQELDLSSALYASLASLQTAHKSGWLNPYLF